MHCPFCGCCDSRVTDSRTAEAGVRRRRECLRCNGRFTTYERVERAAVLVVKKDGRREDFSRAKVLAGVRRACEKRPLEASAIDALVDDVETALAGTGQQEIASSYIGELIMVRLRELDQIAYVRFASVYRSFADIDSMREILDELESLALRNRRPRQQLPLMTDEDLPPAGEQPRVVPVRPVGESPPKRG